MYLLYSFLFVAILAAGVPYFLYKSLRREGYIASWLARFREPDVNPEGSPSIWIHAVSVGEVIAAATLLPRMREAFPDKRIAISVTTVTGRRIADEKLRSDSTDVFYCPFDLATLVRRVIRRVKPVALVVIETEIWPNLFREVRRTGGATFLVNGRISDRSYPRYRRLRWLFETYLAEIDCFCMQNGLYAERIVSMGARKERVRVTGSLKFDATPQARVEGKTRVLPEGRKIWIAGSTLDPEERMLLDVFSALHRRDAELLLVLAPRHPRRFDEVAAIAKREGFEVARRSTSTTPPESADVFILDTLGELAGVYAEADYVFVGGSLVDWGGHNIIEPAAEGKPVLFGPHMQNFADIARSFLDQDAAVQVAGEEGLLVAMEDLLRRPERCRALGENALRVIEANRGATERTIAAMKERLDS
jgi:3-deoxy-D-manno-octulosonic-acid transferase